jgi:hypothetical protein
MEIRIIIRILNLLGLRKFINLKIIMRAVNEILYINKNDSASLITCSSSTNHASARLPDCTIASTNLR